MLSSWYSAHAEILLFKSSELCLSVCPSSFGGHQRMPPLCSTLSPSEWPPWGLVCNRLNVRREGHDEQWFAGHPLQSYPYRVTALDPATEPPALHVLASAPCCLIKGELWSLCMLENLDFACFHAFLNLWVTSSQDNWQWTTNMEISQCGWTNMSMKI